MQRTEAIGVVNHVALNRRETIEEEKARGAAVPALAVPGPIIFRHESIPANPAKDGAQQSVEIQAHFVLIITCHGSVGGRDGIPIGSVPFPNCCGTASKPAI